MDDLSRNGESEETRTPEELGARHGANANMQQESDFVSLAHGSAHANRAARVVCGRMFRRHGAFAHSAAHHATIQASQRGVAAGPLHRCNCNYTRGPCSSGAAGGICPANAGVRRIGPPTQVFGELPSEGALRIEPSEAWPLFVRSSPNPTSRLPWPFVSSCLLPMNSLIRARGPAPRHASPWSVFQHQMSPWPLFAPK